MSSVGESSRRKEGPDKLTGVAKYVDDYHLPNCLYGVTLRSSIARGVVKEIRFDPSYDWDSVVVVTAKDIPGENYVYLIEVDQPLLVDREVHHAEEPLLVLGHATRAKAYEALAHIDVFEAEQYDRKCVQVERLAESGRERGRIAWGYAYVLRSEHYAMMTDVHWDQEVFRSSHLSEFLHRQIRS